MAKKPRNRKTTKLSPEERAARSARATAANIARAAAPKLSPDDFALLAFIRENRDVFDAVVSSYREHLAQETIRDETPIPACACGGVGCTRCAGIHAGVTLASSDELPDDPSYDPFATQVDEPAPVVEVQPVLKFPVVRRGFTDLGKGGFICLDCGTRFTTSPDSCPSCDAPAVAPETRAPLDTCSVCMSPLYDLDIPCETCSKAGRNNSTPEGLHAAQSRQASPGSTAPTVHDVPRISNSVTRAPIPAPAAPLRSYSHTEACISCGRIAELHDSHGGPIGHAYNAPPQSA